MSPDGEGSQGGGEARGGAGRGEPRPGPRGSKAQEEKILSYIEIGKGEGQLVLGGKRLEGEGYFLAPTVFTEVPPKARIAQEEIFGPVLSVIRVKDFAEGLEVANDTVYGLTGGVYSRKREHLERARREFHVGNLYFNRKITGAWWGCSPLAASTSPARTPRRAVPTTSSTSCR